MPQQCTYSAVPLAVAEAADAHVALPVLLVGEHEVVGEKSFGLEPLHKREERLLVRRAVGVRHHKVGVAARLGAAAVRPNNNQL